MIIYKVTNLVTGKIYIGQTRQKLATRWRQHCYTSSNSRGLKGAIIKHGKHNFLVEQLFETRCQATLDGKETQYIKEFNSLVPNGYNLTTGGEGGYVRSAETRRLLSEAGKGKGHPHTAESKVKLSLAKLGSKNPCFGKKQSAETITKRSAALMGRKRPQWVKDKISAGHNPISDKNLTRCK